MLMSIHWGHECTFVFDTLSTDSWVVYIIGCILSGIIAATTIAAPTLKKKLLKSQSNTNSSQTSQPNPQNPNPNTLLTLAYYLLYTTLHVTTMMLVMTYNGGVICTMVFFTALGYLFFGAEDGDSDLPINCCAGTS